MNFFSGPVVLLSYLLGDFSVWKKRQKEGKTFFSSQLNCDTLLHESPTQLTWNSFEVLRVKKSEGDRCDVTLTLTGLALKTIKRPLEES